MALAGITGWGLQGQKISDDDIHPNANLGLTKLGTRTIWINLMPTSAQLSGASCVKTQSNIFGGVVMPDANSSLLYFSFCVPSEMDLSQNCVIEIAWVCAPTSGAAEFFFSLTSQKSAGIVTQEVGGSIVSTAQGTTNRLNSATATGIPGASFAYGDIVGLNIYRIPSGGSDTLSADLKILGIAFKYAGRG